VTEIDRSNLLQARIDSRVAQLRLLAARTAFEFSREKNESWLRDELQPFIRRVFREQLRARSNGHGPKD
jgi:hypothetical protein